MTSFELHFYFFIVRTYYTTQKAKCDLFLIQLKKKSFLLQYSQTVLTKRNDDPKKSKAWRQSEPDACVVAVVM